MRRLAACTAAALACAQAPPFNCSTQPAGAFVPGTAGVSAAAASADGKSVVFTVASGSYSFVVYQVSFSG